MAQTSFHLLGSLQTFGLVKASKIHASTWLFSFKSTSRSGLSHIARTLILTVVMHSSVNWHFVRFLSAHAFKSWRTAFKNIKIPRRSCLFAFNMVSNLSYLTENLVHWGHHLWGHVWYYLLKLCKKLVRDYFHNWTLSILINHLFQVWLVTDTPPSKAIQNTKRWLQEKVSASTCLVQQCAWTQRERIMSLNKCCYWTRDVL